MTEEIDMSVFRYISEHEWLRVFDLKYGSDLFRSEYQSPRGKSPDRALKGTGTLSEGE